MPSSVKLAYFATHPIQYQAPMLRYVVRHSDIDLTAFFLSDMSVKGYFDKEFGQAVQWDVPLLEGYKSAFLPAVGSRDSIKGLRPFTYGVLAALKRGGFDAVWLHGYSHHAMLQAIFWSKVLGIKVLVRAEPNLMVAVRGARTAKLKDAFVRWLFKRIDGFLAIGQMNREYYLHHGVPEDRIFMVPYAVDNDFFYQKAVKAAPVREMLRQELCLEPGRPIILYASKFTTRKKADQLLEAYAALSKGGQEPKPYLVFAGDGELGPQLHERAKELGWDSVRFLGFKNQRELPPLFELADVFVLASAKEPFGLIVNEVMASGTPVIVSDEVCSGPDLVQDGINGFIVPVGDTAALTNALAKATEDPDKTRAMGQRAKERMDTWGFREDLAGLQAALKAVLD